MIAAADRPGLPAVAVDGAGYGAALAVYAGLCCIEHPVLHAILAGLVLADMLSCLVHGWMQLPVRMLAGALDAGAALATGTVVFAVMDLGVPQGGWEMALCFFAFLPAFTAKLGLMLVE